MAKTVLIETKGVGKTFVASAGPTLDDINLTIHEGEFVALLGPSGCGKSTLMRIINGLLPATTGQVFYGGKPTVGANPKAAMVFQTSALFPWLTVQQNVELGLKTQGVPPEKRAEKAEALLRLIGLEGYEDALPKELSGGMRQRVAFARALAVEPELLCMDEPFSTLDPLTAENLRDELLDLWLEERIPLKCILMVTHGIEEAVYMADRIIVLSRNPARVSADIPVQLRYPRDRRSNEFNAMVDYVYKAITGAVDGSDAPSKAKASAAAGVAAEHRARFHRLPTAAVNMLSGLLEMVDDQGGKVDMYSLGGDLLMEVDDLLPLTDAAALLGFARVEEGDLAITPLGRKYIEADPDARKAIFYEQIRDLPLFAMVARVLRAKRNKAMSQEFFADFLAEQFGPEDGPVQLKTLINWGRYAEMFHYDAGAEQLYLDEGDRGLEEPA